MTTARPAAVVLVEGVSDQVAVETLAARRGRDLAADGVAVVPIGGAHAIGRNVAHWGPDGLGVRLSGLVDEAEEAAARRGLQRAGLGRDLTRDGLARLGFHVCVEDLEDELIRALGVSVVEDVVAAQGDGRSWQTFQRQPAQRGRPPGQQLRRFLGTRSGRKVQYARLLVEALDLDHVPDPLDAVLAHV